MLDVVQWRARVGAFHAVQTSSAPPQKGGSHRVLQTRRRSPGASIPILLLVLLLLAGDVHPNPGPPKITRSQAARISERVLQDFFPRVSEIFKTCLERIAEELLSKGVIDWEVMNDLSGTHGLSPTQKCHKLLYAVRCKITSDESDTPFRKLCDVMKDFPVMDSLVKEMLERFEYLCLNDSSLSDKSSDQEERTTCTITRDSNSASSSSTTAADVDGIVPSWCSSPAVKEYIEYLKKIYQRTAFPIYLKKPLITFHAKQFINMVLVHKDRVADEKQRDELVHARLYGEVDKIQGAKTPLKMEEVGKQTDGSPAHHVLIEGAPGIGKTTFAWELCRQWSRGNALKHWPLVVLVQLRHKRVRQAKSLWDLVYHSDPGISKAVCQEVVRAGGEGLLLIFEGFDELSELQRSESSIFQQIISLDFLPFVSLMVTSRPIARHALGKGFSEQVKQHIEIVGFTKSNIDEYVTSACHDKESLHKDLSSYIEAHPFVYSIMYIPLHCCIVTELYRTYWKKAEKEFAPKTLTELYTALVQMLLSRHLDDHPEYGQQELRLRKFSDLPDRVKYQLRDLAQLAANTIQEKKYVFDSVPGGDSMGLLVAVEDVYVPFDQGQSVSFSFLHATIQEYLAAYWWSELPPPQREEIIMQPALLPTLMTPGMLESFAVILVQEIGKDAGVHFPALLFLSGLTKLKGLNAMLGTSTSKWKEHSRYERFAADCLEVSSHYCQLLFESQSQELVAEIFTSNKFVCYCESTIDSFVAGYVIAHSSPSSSWSVKLVDRSSDLHHVVRMLGKGLHYSSSHHGGKLHEILLHFHDVRDDVYNSLKALYHLRPFSLDVCRLHFLDSSIDRTPVQSSLVAEDVVVQLASCYPSLKHLSLSCVRSYITWRPLLLNAPQFICLDSFEFLSMPVPAVKDHIAKEIPQVIKPLRLKSFGLSVVDQSSDIISQGDFSNMPTLERFFLSFIGLSRVDISVLSHYLTSPQCNLRILGLKSCAVSVADFKVLCSALTNNQTLKILSLIRVRHPKENWPIPALAQLFQQHKTLEQINFFCLAGCDVVKLRPLVESVQGSSQKILGLDLKTYHKMERLSWNMDLNSIKVLSKEEAYYYHYH